MINVPITFDEAYEFIKLYDTLRDMDFELTESQQNVFEKLKLTPKRKLDQSMIKDYQLLIVIMMRMLMALIKLKK